MIGGFEEIVKSTITQMSDEIRTKYQALVTAMQSEAYKRQARMDLRAKRATEHPNRQDSEEAYKTQAEQVVVCLIDTLVDAQYIDDPYPWQDAIKEPLQAAKSRLAFVQAEQGARSEEMKDVLVAAMATQRFIKCFETLYGQERVDTTPKMARRHEYEKWQLTKDEFFRFLTSATYQQLHPNLEWILPMAKVVSR